MDSSERLSKIYEPSRYGNKAMTVESTDTPQWLQSLLFASIVIHCGSGVLLLAFGIHFYTQCSFYPSPFIAGITPIIAALYLLFALLAAIFMCTGSGILSAANALIMSLLGILMTANEAGIYSCTSPGFETSCLQFRQIFNLCHWMSKSPAYNSEPTANSNICDANCYYRRVCLAFSIISMINSMALFAVVAYALKIGKPVYLRILRHRGTIQCGEGDNYLLAFVNKRKNIESSTVPKEAETDFYSKSRQAFIEQYTGRNGGTTLAVTTPVTEISPLKKQSTFRRSASRSDTKSL